MNTVSVRTCTYYNRRRRLCCTECGATVDLCQCTDVEEMAFLRLTSETGRFLRAVFLEAIQHEGGSHLVETALLEFGVAVDKIVQNNRDHSVADSEIRRALIQLAGTIALLAAVGTPEYAYPSSET